MLLTTDPKLGSHMRGPAMVVDFSSQKKGAKNPQVEVCSYLGNLFAVLPLVRYYWATFCRRQFRGFRASLVFTVPTSSPLSSHNLCHFFLSLPCQFFHSAVTQFSRKIFTRNGDQWSVPRARINCRRRASGVSLLLPNISDGHTDRFPRFPAPAK